MADDNTQNLIAGTASSNSTAVSSDPVADVPVATAPVATAPVAEAPVATAPVADAPLLGAPVANIADVPVPDWLKKAQTLAQHEESIPAVTLTETGNANVEKPLDLPAEKTLTPAELVDAPLPPWLKKASEQISGKAEGETVISQENILDSTPLANAEVKGDSNPGNMVQPSLEPNKSDLFNLAKGSFLSALDKGKKVIEDAQTAGAKDVSTSDQIAETNVVEPAIPAEPENAVVDQNAAEPENAEIPEISTSVNPVEPSKPEAVEVKTAKLDPRKEAALAKAAEAKAKIEEQKKLVEAEKIYQQGLSTIRDLIAPSSMEIRYDMIRVEGMFAQSFFVYAYPRYLDTNWLSPIVNFDVTMDISQFIYPIESATIMRVLKKKVAQMQASVRINSEKGMVSDPALETALQDAEELRTEIQRGQEKFFQFALYFTIYSEDDKKIQKMAKQLESILGAKLILTKKAELQAEMGFNSCLPLCLDELEVQRNMNTSPLSSTFPFSSSDLTSNEGILYGLNRHNDSLIIFDRFSLENANSVVFAKSGAGKSYCVKLEILRSMMLGTDVIIIDPEREYQDLCQTVGGSYLKVSLTSDRRINPFDLPAAIHDEELQPGDLLRSNIITLHGLLKIMLGGLTPEEEGILDKALNDVYSVKGITMDLVDPSNLVPPTMEDLFDILTTMEGGQSMAQRLQKYTTGTYSGIFNKATNVDLGTGLIVFSIRDLEESLRPIAMYIILNYIWNRIRSQLKRRLLVIDEAWWMMQHEDSARFLFGLVKRARKYYLGITTITQDVEDFVKSPYGRPVVTNSSMQVLLKQAPAAIDVLGKVFNLTDGEKYMLLNSGVGQGLFFAGNKHVAIQVIASYTEDKIVTTNPEEILKNKADDVSYEA